MKTRIVLGIIVAGLIGTVFWWYLFADTASRPVTTFEECESYGNPVSEDYPRQCHLSNGQVFIEDLGPRAEAFRACATADIPLVSIDTVFDVEEGSVEVRWSDPQTGEEKFLLLPYDPLNIYKGCSDSAKRVLRHVSGVDMFPTEIPKAVSVARTYVAQRIKVNESEVMVISVTQKDWPNACLGMPGNVPEDEMCAELVTPGYEVILDVKGQEFIYRTNLDGSEVRPAN